VGHRVNGVTLRHAVHTGSSPGNFPASLSYTFPVVCLGTPLPGKPSVRFNSADFRCDFPTKQTAISNKAEEDLRTDREVRREGAHPLLTFEPAMVKPTQDASMSEVLVSWLQGRRTCRFFPSGGQNHRQYSILTDGWPGSVGGGPLQQTPP